MAVPDSLKNIFSYVDNNRERFISDLAEAVKIKSVSAWIQNREVHRESTFVHIYGANFIFPTGHFQNDPLGR